MILHTLDQCDERVLHNFNGSPCTGEVPRCPIYTCIVTKLVNKSPKYS